MQYINNNLGVLLYKAGLDLGLQSYVSNMSHYTDKTAKFATDLQTNRDKFVVELISRNLKQVAFIALLQG